VNIGYRSGAWPSEVLFHPFECNGGSAFRPVPIFVCDGVRILPVVRESPIGVPCCVGCWVPIVGIQWSPTLAVADVYDFSGSFFLLRMSYELRDGAHGARSPQRGRIVEGEKEQR
jgi:hypothetical protein